jgi:hypothetical protein
MESKDRLKAIMKELMYAGEIASQRDFGEKLGYKSAFTSQLLNGHKMPGDLPNKIYQIFGIEWEPKDSYNANELAWLKEKVALLEKISALQDEIDKLKNP